MMGEENKALASGIEIEVEVEIQVQIINNKDILRRTCPLLCVCSRKRHTTKKYIDQPDPEEATATMPHTTRVILNIARYKQTMGGV